MVRSSSTGYASLTKRLSFVQEAGSSHVIGEREGEGKNKKRGKVPHAHTHFALQVLYQRLSYIPRVALWDPPFSWSVIPLRILQHARWKLRPRHPKRDHVKQNKSDRCNATIHFHIGIPIASQPLPKASPSVLSLFCLPPNFFSLLRIGCSKAISSGPLGPLRTKSPLFFFSLCFVPFVVRS